MARQCTFLALLVDAGHTRVSDTIDILCVTTFTVCDLVGTNLLNETDTNVRTTEAFLIPPRSEAIIPVMVPPSFAPGLSIIEPLVKLHRLQLALASQSCLQLTTVLYVKL